MLAEHLVPSHAGTHAKKRNHRVAACIPWMTAAKSEPETPLRTTQLKKSFLFDFPEKLAWTWDPPDQYLLVVGAPAVFPREFVGSLVPRKS